MQFKNKVVVVTGSSSGIGKAVAEAFAKQGAKLVINSRNVTAGEEVANGIVASGGEAIYLQADVSQPGEVSAFFQKIVEVYGTVDVLVNNAGYLPIKQNFLDIDYTKWHEMLDVTLTSVVLCSQEAVKIMKKSNHGVIINTSSIRGIDYMGREIAYAAAKAGVNNFTKTLAKEVLSDHITVNAIAAGKVNTPYLERYSLEEKQKQMKQIPMGRFIEPEELANAYLFLASSPYITGTILVADAGLSLKME